MKINDRIEIADWEITEQFVGLAVPAGRMSTRLAPQSNLIQPRDRRTCRTRSRTGCASCRTPMDERWRGGASGERGSEPGAQQEIARDRLRELIVRATEKPKP